MRFPILLLAQLAAVASPPAHAQTAAEVETVWRSWMSRNGRTTGGFAVLHQGRVAHEAVLGKGGGCDGIGQPPPTR